MGAILLTLAWGTHRAAAQAVNSGVGIGPSQEVARPAQPTPTRALDAPVVERLLGDWDSPGTRLWEHGVNLLLDAVTEFAGNTGGLRQGSTFASQVGLEADINWERLASVTGLSTHVIVVNRSGSSDSALFGDRLSPVQEIYGAGGDVAVHLVSAYAEETLGGRWLDVAAGRMNVEADFASSPLYCSFMNNGLCGDPKALPGGDIGHSAYPDAVWASRVRVRPMSQTYLETGLYEVDRGLYGTRVFRSGFEFDTSLDSGVYVPVEFGWEPALGHGRLPSHYKLGLGYDSSGGYEGFSAGLAAAGVPGHDGGPRHGATQLWALADQMLVRTGSDDDDGVTVLAGFVRNDPSRSVYAEQYFAGLVARHFWTLRPQDTVGLLVTRYRVSGQLGRAQAVEAQLGLPLTNGATGIQTQEQVVEANYDIHLRAGLSFDPDLQYVHHPNAQSSIHDALVFGFKSHMEF